MEHLTAETFGQNALDALNDVQLRGALRNLTKTFSERRKIAITTVEDWEGLREKARAIKDETLLHLDKYLEKFVENAEKNGAKIHWARDGNRLFALAHSRGVGKTSPWNDRALADRRSTGLLNPGFR